MRDDYTCKEGNVPLREDKSKKVVGTNPDDGGGLFVMIFPLKSVCIYKYELS